MEAIRNNSAHPGFAPGLKVFAETVTNTDAGSAHDFVLETGCTYVHFHLAFSGTTIVAGTVADSTTYPGTKKITWANPASGVLKILVVGSTEQDSSNSMGADKTEVGFDTI